MITLNDRLLSHFFFTDYEISEENYRKGVREHVSEMNKVEKFKG